MPHSDGTRWDIRSAVRRRPGMYFGSARDRGMTRALLEVVSNAVDAVLPAQHGHITVELPGPREAVIADNGPGFAVHGVEELVSILTEMHDSPTRDGHTPHVHVGSLTGVGLSAVAAACASFSVTTTNEQQTYCATVVEGEVTAATVENRPIGRATGTTVNLVLDESVLAGVWEEALIHWRLFELSCLCPNLTVHSRGHTMKHELGDLLPGSAKAAPFHTSDVSLAGGHRLRIAVREIQTAGSSLLMGYVNLEQVRRGSLIKGLRDGVEGDRRSAWPSVHAVADLWHPEPTFAGPTRDELNAPDIELPVAEAMAKLLETSGISRAR